MFYHAWLLDTHVIGIISGPATLQSFWVHRWALTCATGPQVIWKLYHLSAYRQYKSLFDPVQPVPTKEGYGVLEEPWKPSELAPSTIGWVA